MIGTALCNALRWFGFHGSAQPRLDNIADSISNSIKSKHCQHGGTIAKTCRSSIKGENISRLKLVPTWNKRRFDRASTKPIRTAKTS